MNEGRDLTSLMRANTRRSTWRDLLETFDSSYFHRRQTATKVQGLSSTLPATHPPVDRYSLFGEILDFMIAPLMFLLPLSLALTFVVSRSLADEPFDRILADRVGFIARQLELSVPLESISPTSAKLGWVNAYPSASDIFQVSLADSTILVGDRTIPLPQVYDFANVETLKFRQELIRGEEYRVAFKLVDVPGRVEPVLIQVAENTANRLVMTNQIIRGTVIPQFALLPLSLLLAWFGLRRGLRPVTRLQRQLDERKQNDLSPISSRNAPEEIAPLLDSFNDLLDRLKSSMRLQQRFIADAAHQMKTPLAGLQTQVELALRQSPSEEQRATLQQISRSAKRTARLVSQLLALARAEHHRTGLPIGKINLTALGREVCADWFSHAMAKSIDLGFEATAEDLIISGQSVVLREMMNNLIDNSIRYTPAGGTITVRVYGSAIGGVRFEVEDNGPGISRQDQAHVFERFYTVLGMDNEGSGLGLAIVKEIAEQHNAEIRLYSHVKDNPDRMPHGTRISVIFPN